MAGFSQFELEKAIYQTLINYATLNAMISGVFDQVPEHASFPYISIGESVSRDWSTKTTSGAQISVTLHIFSRYGGKKQAIDVMRRIHELLHQGNLSLSGHVLIMMRFEYSNVSLESDGSTYQGVIRLRALTEEV